MRTSRRSPLPVRHELARWATCERHDQGPSGHCFKGPIEFLVDEKPALAASRVLGFEVTREFAGLAKYVALACEAGQGVACG